MNVKLIIFSGTGNTRLISKTLLEKIDTTGNIECELVEVEDLVNNRALKIDKTTILGIGFPVYDLKPPEIIMKFIDKLGQSKNSNRAFVFSTYTSYPLDANSFIISKLTGKAYDVIATENFKCPGASAYFYSNPENILVKGKTVFEKAIDWRLNNFSNLILNNQNPIFYGFHKFNWLHQKFTELTMGNLFYKNLKIDSTCSNCGLCVKNCPVKNIQYMENKVTVLESNKCLRCLRCVQCCPQESINFTSSKRRGNYTFQNIKKYYSMVAQ